MKVIRRPSAFAAVSELRTGMDAILAQLKETPVSLEKHGKSVAVLVDPERFEAMERALEEVSDLMLADEAHRRAQRLKGRGPGSLRRAPARRAPRLLEAPRR
ncbi:MAG: hypothetical protein A2V88_06795 [Elusimicrobia bacterium RBG_16_66_12]|nr:MAG: hypothetical protein A2V88_06795 [Elusimicrobia bacterium RBG_16_66_12]